MPPGWCALTADGAVLDLAVVPNARHSGPAGLHDGALRVRVAAPAVEGAANQALLRWLADGIGLRLADLRVVSGAHARRKRIAVTASHDDMQRWLQTLDAPGDA